MPNAEAQMTNQAQNPNNKLGIYAFGIDLPFGFRYLAFMNVENYKVLKLEILFT